MNNDKNEKGLINQQDVENLYAGIRNILANARQRAYSAVNFAMVESYWLIGQQIVEHEQHGNSRKKETTPDGGKDENVFDIMQGVSINIFIKKKK
jgi:hypothetical protein